MFACDNRVTGKFGMPGNGISLTALGEPNSGTPWLERLIPSLALELCGSFNNLWCVFTSSRQFQTCPPTHKLPHVFGVPFRNATTRRLRCCRPPPVLQSFSAQSLCKAVVDHSHDGTKINFGVLSCNLRGQGRRKPATCVPGGLLKSGRSLAEENTVQYSSPGSDVSYALETGRQPLPPRRSQQRIKHNSALHRSG